MCLFYCRPVPVCKAVPSGHLAFMRLRPSDPTRGGDGTRMKQQVVNAAACVCGGGFQGQVRGLDQSLRAKDKSAAASAAFAAGWGEGRVFDQAWCRGIPHVCKV